MKDPCAYGRTVYRSQKDGKGFCRMKQLARAADNSKLNFIDLFIHSFIYLIFFYVALATFMTENCVLTCLEKISFPKHLFYIHLGGSIIFRFLLL